MWFGSRTWLTTSCVLCRESTNLTWDEDEPSTAVAEEESAPTAEEFTPAPQAESEAPAVEATLPEASTVEGEYTALTQLSSRSSRIRQERLIQLSFVDRSRSRREHHPRGGAC
jgi:hypothetical protein